MSRRVTSFQIRPLAFIPSYPSYPTLFPQNRTTPGLQPLPQPLHRPFMPAFQILQLLGQLFDPLLEFATHIRIVGIGD